MKDCQPKWQGYDSYECYDDEKYYDNYYDYYYENGYYYDYGYDDYYYYNYYEP